MHHFFRLYTNHSTFFPLLISLVQEFIAARISICSEVTAEGEMRGRCW